MKKQIPFMSEQRLIYKDPPAKPRGEGLVERPSAGGFADWADWKGGARGEGPSWAREDHTSASLEPLRAEVRATQETKDDLKDVPRPVTPKAKDKLKVRTQNEIFGDAETQKWYLEMFGAAFAALSKDKLYEFIMAHQSYEARADHVKWNKDFAALFGIPIPDNYKGKTEEMTNRRITAAVQHYLVENYHNDVFQITQKTINPWIFIDGRMGPYSVSVLAEYWNAKYKKDDPQHRDATRAHVAGEYEPDGPAAQAYTGAMDYLDVQLADDEGLADEGEEPEPPVPADPNEAAKAKYAGLDKSPAMDAKSLRISNYGVDTKLSLTNVLALAYSERTDGDSTQAPKTYHVLNLLAQKKGAEVDKMEVQAGDVLDISEDLTFLVTKSDGTVRHGPIKMS